MDGVKQGNVLTAIQAYQYAQAIDTGLEIAPWIWDLLCWFGSLHNQVAEILFASEKATQSNADSPISRDTRGLVRALSGDLQGAIEDFESVLEKISDSTMYKCPYRSLGLEDDARERREWLNALRLGQNPFTPKVLEALREQEGIRYGELPEEAADENG
jgi:hypothetical protein